MSFSREEIARLKAEFLVAFHQCGNASEAARRVGAKRGSVTGWLRAAGVVARGQAGPGSGHRRADHPAKAEYARLRAEGLSNTAAARRVGINPRTGRDWHQGIRHTANARIYPDGRVVDYNTGMTRKQAKLARLEKSIDARFLALAERELITDLLSTGASLREIARRLDRAPSTISRELRRNAPGNGSYGAYRAQRAAVARRERPKARKLDTSPRLRAYVIDKLRLRWSPEQICHAMEQEFPGEVEMRVTHETIYQALYVQACGSLRKEIAASVRTGRIRRKPRRTPGERTPRFSDGMVMISERPAEIEVIRPGFSSDLSSRKIGSIMPKPYDQDFKDRALRMLAEALPERGSVHAASKHVGGLLGISPDTLRIWYRQTQIDAGSKPGVTTDMAAENRRLQREVDELRKANEVLKAASIFFAKELDQPRTK